MDAFLSVVTLRLRADVCSVGMRTWKVDGVNSVVRFFLPQNIY